jgi:ribosome assembly protein 1
VVNERSVLIPRMRRKEQLIADARAKGKSADDAVAETEDAVLKDQFAAIDGRDGLEQSAPETPGVNGSTDDRKAELRLLKDFESSIETGFQLATFQGPLCSEPVVGMAWTVESIEYHRCEGEDEAGTYRARPIAQIHKMGKRADKAGRGRPSAVVGALISSVRDSCRQGLLDWSPRIKLAMYTCDIQASTDVLGKVYGVVARRRGRIVSEEMKEGTSFFTIRAMLPVVESFGFADGQSLFQKGHSTVPISGPR